MELGPECFADYFGHKEYLERREQMRVGLTCTPTSSKISRWCDAWSKDAVDTRKKIEEHDLPLEKDIYRKVIRDLIVPNEYRTIQNLKGIIKTLEEKISKIQEFVNEQQ